MNKKTVDFVIKCVILGSVGVGKTIMLKKMTEKIFINKYQPTLGVDFFTLYTSTKKYNFKMHFWDITGHESFQKVVKVYYKNNAICYVMYDVCDIASFRAVPQWINVYKKNSLNTNTILVILANKIDDVHKRIVTLEEGKNLANINKAIYIEISSKTMLGLDEIVLTPLTRLINMLEKKEIEPIDTNGIRNVKNERNIYEQEYKKCCSIQ